MLSNPFSLESKTVLITGASSGIGRATAIECAKIGAHCVITGRNQERLQQTFEQLEGQGHVQIIADLASQEGIQTLAEQVPQLDGLVNNAGINLMKPIGFIKGDDLEKIYTTNTFAPILLTKFLLKKKKIINFAFYDGRVLLSRRICVTSGRQSHEVQHDDSRPLGQYPCSAESDQLRRSAPSGAAHEIIHGLRDMKGEAVPNASVGYDYIDQNEVSRHGQASLEELQTVGISGNYGYTENKIRAEHGLPLRRNYR